MEAWVSIRKTGLVLWLVHAEELADHSDDFVIEVCTGFFGQVGQKVNQQFIDFVNGFCIEVLCQEN